MWYLRVTSIETSTNVEELGFPMRGRRVRCVDRRGRVEGRRERNESGNCYNMKEFGFVATVSSFVYSTFISSRV